jgi:hypothetical protein
MIGLPLERRRDRAMTTFCMIGESIHVTHENAVSISRMRRGSSGSGVAFRIRARVICRKKGLTKGWYSEMVAMPALLANTIGKYADAASIWSMTKAASLWSWVVLGSVLMSGIEHNRLCRDRRQTTRFNDLTTSDNP